MDSRRGISDSLVSRISGVGLIVGTFFMAMSLTPSLIPRSDLVQGVLAGVCFAVGYGIGLLAKAVWLYIQLPTPGDWLARRIFFVSGSLSALMAAVFFIKAADWQNAIRDAMGIEPVAVSLPIAVGTIAAGVAIILVGFGKLVGILWRRVSRRLGRYIRPRLARIIGLALVLWVIMFLGNGLLFSGLLRMADSSAQTLDAVIEPDTTPPADPLRTGSAQSLISWEDLGREGRNFIGNALDADQIRQVTGLESMDPIRVYVGLNAADDPQERAALAVAELERIGGFGRRRLVIATPTGTGWMDPAAFETLEYLQRGDVATVAIQYSYLQSWLSLIVEPEYSTEAGRALFSAVYAKWKQLPEATRPELFLYGLSLGAYSSQQSMRLHEIIDDPVAGALWVGPPFVSPLWQTLTAERDPASPAWLPRVDQGQLVRFTNGSAGLGTAGQWGRMRIVYLQYASDPIVFFKTDGAFRKPDWMAEPRGPDVSPELRWYPIVSFLQLAFDMAIALAVPMGHGHLYSYTDHMMPWMEVMPPEGLDPESLARIGQYLETRDD